MLMTLSDIVRRQQPPLPWAEGEKIPWNDPAFSQRMLREHLTQVDDRASRRFEIIDRHVAWIHDTVLGGRPSGVLDLGCGPGLYAHRLARLGHRCTGVDFSPASIAHAREQAAEDGVNVRYIEADIRTIASLGLEPVDLVMLIYGEFNVFRREDALSILVSARRLLRPGGHLLLEPHSFDLVRTVGTAAPSWYSAASGLFSEQPHLVMTENSWAEAEAVATERYFVVDAATCEVTRYASSMQAYTPDGYAALLAEAGFGMPRVYASLAGDDGPVHDGLIALLAAACT